MRRGLLGLSLLLSIVAGIGASGTEDGASRMLVLKRTAACPVKTYKDATTLLCTPCVDPNALKCSAGGALSCSTGTYLYQGTCLSVCPSGTRKAGHGCITCTDPNAVTCSSSTAMSCVPTFFVYLGVCVTPCPTGTRRNAQNLRCEACSDPDAPTCTKFRATSCSTLNLSDGACVTTCPTETFAQNHVCTRCVDPNARTCDSSGATSCKKLDLYAGACVVCPDGTHSKSHVCVPCKETDAKTCSSSAATSCHTLNLSNGACIAACPAGTYSLSQVCTACIDGGAATCGADGSSLTCTDSTYQVDTTTGICGPTAPVGTAFSRIQDYEFGDQTSVRGAFHNEAGCITAWIALGRNAAYMAGSVCLVNHGTIIAFSYSAEEDVKSYLTGSCASNAGLFANTELFNADATDGPPPFTPAAMCQDVTFANGVCTVDSSGLVCGFCPDPDANTCIGSLSISCNTLNLSDGVCIGTCPAGTYALNQVCTACPDSGAATCGADGSSLTCSDTTYQVDTTTGICAAPKAVTTVFSRIPDFYITLPQFTPSQAVLSETDCIVAWIDSGTPEGTLSEDICSWDDGGVPSFTYSAYDGVVAYLYGSCAKNAALFASTPLHDDDNSDEGPPPVNPAANCQDVTFSDGVCTVVSANTLCF